MEESRKQALNTAHKQLMEITLNQAPIEGLDKLVDKKVMGFGTTLNEEIHSLEEYIKLIQDQEKAAKAQNLEFSFDRKRIHERISPDQDTAVFIEKITCSIKLEGVENRFVFRFSSVMEYNGSSWKLVHWHGSIPSDVGDDTWHVNEWKAEKEKLEKLVAEQTADLQQKNLTLEIEAASEKVRAHAMSMQQPNDIIDVLSVIKEEILKFDLGNIAIWIWIHNNDGTITQWDISEFIPAGIEANFNFTFNPSNYSQINRHAEHWNNGTPHYYDIHWAGKDLQSLIQEVSDIDPNSGKIFQDAVDSEQFTEYWQASSPFNQGVIGLDFIQDPPKNASPLIIKMAKAFGLAYQRFGDLQKAEAQAKETQIELSMERIRAHVSAMHESSEILDIVVSLRREFITLGYEAHYFWYMRWFEDHYEKAMTSGDGSKIGMVMTLPRTIHSEIQSVAEWEEGEESTMVLAMDTDMAQEYVEKMTTLGDFERVNPNAPTLEDIHKIGGLTFIMARTSLGEIGYSLPGVVTDPPQEALNILERFASVFDLAYKRFEDLKKAERQAYESKVEASLERVRGMAAAMNHSDDLIQIVEEMFMEMKILKIKPLRYGMGMINGETKEAELWASTVNDGRFLDELGKVSLTWHPMLQKAFDAWDAQLEEMIYRLEGKELNLYYERISKVNSTIKNLDSLLDPNTEVVQYASFFPFKNGALYAFTENIPNEDGLSILKRFANVFEQAYTRFEDLEKTEKQARLIHEERDRLEVTLKELRATQDQLVQQEKLASLGQLTAGIAHEIKNPLNFVNNFSDLSIELIEEIREELEKDPADTEEALEILNDVQSNLKKIYEHGSRADSIVKSMLEHSRGGSGTMEPTNLNSIVKEFVNLSFHGMRASKDPINVDLQFDLNDSVDVVPLIAEDFSRVIINLCSNAFDAMRQKVYAEGNRPILAIRTKRLEKTVTIEIEDNGPGIPQNMIDKILQPFFTTKKGKQGTGLGLSITNDIIKAHGGALDVISTPSEKTIFTIILNES